MRKLRAPPDPLNVEKLKASEFVILQDAQRRHFSDEVKRLSRRQPVKRDSKLANLDPLLKDGLLCTGSRLRFAPHAVTHSRDPPLERSRLDW